MARLGGDTPAAFVSGLATALEVEDASAWTIVHAAVAARGRSTLTDALAAQLRDDSAAVCVWGGVGNMNDRNHSLCRALCVHVRVNTILVDTARCCKSCWRFPMCWMRFRCRRIPQRLPWWGRPVSSVRACSFARLCF